MNDNSTAVDTVDIDLADGFASLGLHEQLLADLEALGHVLPTPIQREAIPAVLAGHDLLGQAATGTGKTAAFALPILDRIARSNVRPGPVAIVLTPTRELAVQVSEAFNSYGSTIGARVAPIYGGQQIGLQLGALRRGVDVVVATPGRALDHLKRGSLPLDHVAIVVLDEADEMMDMGFAEDIEAILDALPTDRQTLLFSATMPPRIEGLARRHLTDPTHVRIEPEVTLKGATPRVGQIIHWVHRSDRAAALCRVLDMESPEAAIVFCRTRSEVDELTEALNGRGHRAEALHGGMDQDQRDRVMGRVRAGVANLLVATDVAARGLDIDHLTHVFNFDVPTQPEQYVHRIGRVGRAGRVGTAITLATPGDRHRVREIERTTGVQMTVRNMPTLEEVRRCRRDRVVESIRALLEEAPLDDHLAIAMELAADRDPIEVAAAALRAAHEAAGATLPEDERDIPDATPRPENRRNDRDRSHGTARRGFDRDRSRGEHGRGERAERAVAAGHTRLFVGAGRRNGVRPQDLVGAICGETSLRGHQIGAIRITENFSLVEVPSSHADEVIRRLSTATIKGRRPTVRPDRGGRS